MPISLSSTSRPRPASNWRRRPESSGDFLPTAQGEDVVSGVRSRSLSPSCACGCIRSPISSWIVPKLAGHYKDMQDTEFTARRRFRPSS